MATYKITETGTGTVRVIKAESERAARDHIFNGSHTIETVKKIDDVVTLFSQGTTLEIAGEDSGAAAAGEDENKDAGEA